MLKLLFFITQIDSTDCFSKLICEDCTKELMVAAKFRQKCQTAKETLSEYLANDKQNATEVISADEIQLMQTLVAPKHKIQCQENIEEQLQNEKEEVKEENYSTIETSYEEVEYLDSNIMEIFPLNTTKKYTNEMIDSEDFLIDDIIEETDEDESQIKFAQESLDDKKKVVYQTFLF